MTIKTILNSAPVIIQAASKLVGLIKERKTQASDDSNQAITLEQLQASIERIESRLNSTDEANLEQIRLIEQLAKQNELLATSQQGSMQKITLLFILVIMAILLAVATLILQ